MRVIILSRDNAVYISKSIIYTIMKMVLNILTAPLKKMKKISM